MLSTKNQKLCISTADTHCSKISKYHPHHLIHKGHREDSLENLYELNPYKTDKFVHKI